MIAAIVDTRELLETVLYATVAGVGITFVFSLAIYGAIRYADLSRDERPLAAFSAGAVAVLSFLFCLAAVAAGIVVMVAG